MILFILFTSFIFHGFSHDTIIILGTVILIPKDKGKSLSRSSNYRTIALSSIFDKI